MEPLHDNDDGSVSAIDTISDGCLEMQIDCFPVVVGQSVCGLYRVVNDNSPAELPFIALILDCASAEASYLTER